MNEYQISADRNGQFLFRTEWDDDRSRVRAAAIAIQPMPDVKVTIRSRCKLRSDVTAEVLRPDYVESLNE